MEIIKFLKIRFGPHYSFVQVTCESVPEVLFSAGIEKACRSPSWPAALRGMSRVPEKSWSWASSLALSVAVVDQHLTLHFTPHVVAKPNSFPLLIINSPIFCYFQELMWRAIHDCVRLPFVFWTVHFAIFESRCEDHVSMLVFLWSFGILEFKLLDAEASVQTALRDIYIAWPNSSLMCKPQRPSQEGLALP